jgi:hypothetical protein
VHDLVDWVSEESRRAGTYASAWLRGDLPKTQFRTKAGANVRYVNPGRISPDRDNRIYLRSMVVKNESALEIRLDNRLVKTLKKGHVQPSEMISLNLGPKDFEGAAVSADSVLEIGIA